MFNNNELTNIIILDPKITPEKCKETFKHFHTTIISHYLKKNQITNITQHDINFAVQAVPYYMCTKLASTKLYNKTKSQFLQSYLHILNIDTNISQCSLYLTHTWNLSHFYLQQHTISLWKNFCKQQQSSKNEV